MKPSNFPVKVDTFENSLLFGASATCTGRRRSNEDDHDARLFDNGGIFGVYDGHGGVEACQFLKKHLIEHISHIEEPERYSADSLVSSFLDLDSKLHQLNSNNKERVSTEAGATAVLAVVAKQDSMWKVTCANVGDSRCILIQNGTATTLSVLHHPGVPEEKSRIEKAGGMVTFDRLGNSRVFGVLAVSRAFGDFEFKVPTEMVTAQPHVKSITIPIRNDLLLLSCDGLFEPKEMTIEFIVSFIENQLQLVENTSKGLGIVIEKLILKALSCGSQDNITAILVRLSPSNTTQM